MTTSAQSPATSWLRRLLGATLTLTFSLATLAGLVLAGVVVTSRSVNQPVLALARASSASLQHAEPATVSPALTRNGRRFVVAFVVGASGTIASDLLAPYDIFASSPAFTTYVAASSARPAA